MEISYVVETEIDSRGPEGGSCHVVSRGVPWPDVLLAAKAYKLVDLGELIARYRKETPAARIVVRHRLLKISPAKIVVLEELKRSSERS
jgi:hypothetical protein